MGKQLTPIRVNELEEQLVERDREILQLKAKLKTVHHDFVDHGLEQLFLVWNSEECAHHSEHTSHSSANKEAERLAQTRPGRRFYVLVAVGNALAAIPEPVWTPSAKRFSDDNNPF